MEPDPTLRPDRQPEDADRALGPRRSTSSSARPRRGRTCGLHRKRAAPGRGDGPHAVPRAAGPGQDDARPDHRARARRGVPDDLGAGAGEGGRPRRDPDEPRTARRPLHRRDPPAEPGGRGGALPRARGFRARPRDRRGAGGADGADRAPALHAGGGHDAARAPDDAARDRFGIPTRLQFYEVAELHEIVTRGARLMGVAAEPEGRSRSRGARGGRRGSRGGSCGGSSISRWSRATGGSRARSRTGRSRGSGWIIWGSTGRTGGIWGSWPRTTRAGRWGSRRCRPRCPKAAIRSRR
jgi:holliday junction DNA helicase RuvB